VRAVVQRVAYARVLVDGEVVGEIGLGALVLLGIARGDGEDAVDRFAERLATYRMFADDQGRMNRALGDVGGAVLVVSQFTLCADVRKGRRPSFDGAEAPERAAALCARCVDQLARAGLSVASGRFGAAMRVELENHGPVTFVFDG
jgi:D-aminoacyl-tRNA deacylase